MLQNFDLLNAHETIFFDIHARRRKNFISAHRRERKKEIGRESERERERESTISVLFVAASSREVVSECQYYAGGRRSSEMRVQPRNTTSGMVNKRWNEGFLFKIK